MLLATILTCKGRNSLADLNCLKYTLYDKVGRNSVSGRCLKFVFQRTLWWKMSDGWGMMEGGRGYKDTGRE